MNSANPDQTIIKCHKIIIRLISDKCKVCQPEHRPDNYQVSSAKPKVDTPTQLPQHPPMIIFKTLLFICIFQAIISVSNKFFSTEVYTV